MNSISWITLILILFISVALLYLYWRVRYGPPRRDFPSVLAYHKVTSFEFGGTWVTRRGFERQIDFLILSGYRFISEREFVDTLDGKRAGSVNELLLTFDDGYRELLRTAVPILTARGVPALVFLVTSFVGKRNSWELGLPGRNFMHMDWEEAKDLVEAGFSIGSHSQSHSDLTRLDLEEVRREVALSRTEIEERLGHEVLSFSYPYGRSNEAVRDIVRESGYRAAFSMYPSHKNAIIDRFNIRRNGVYIIDAPFTVREKIAARPLFWVEDVKCRAINAFAVLTPILKSMGKSIR